MNHRHLHHHGAGDAAGRTLALAGLAAVLGASWLHWRDTHRRRHQDRPATQPEREQVWEGEGGQNQMPDAPPSS